MLRTFFLAAASLIALPALAQDKPGDPAPAPKDDIVVKGQRDKKEVQTFVKSLAPSRDDRQIARWNGEVCARVVGLWPERDKMILSHIAAVAQRIGVKYKSVPDCTPNTVIAFTGNADKFTATMLDEFPNLVTNVGSNGLPPKNELARYLAPRPVRWFAINGTTMDDGTSVGTMGDGGGAAGPGRDVNAAPRSIAASRIGMRTRENTMASLIVVDESKLNGIRWDQLADYIAMVTFAQPAIDADFGGTDSVMAIFNARDAGTPGPIGLTDQDNVFLTALYRTDSKLSGSGQRGVIVDALKKGEKKN